MFINIYGWQYDFIQNNKKRHSKTQIADFIIQIGSWTPKWPKIAKKRITQSRFVQKVIIRMVYFRCCQVNPHVSRRSRICVPKEVRGCLRPSYRRPKFTLFFPPKKAYLRCLKSVSSKIFEIELAHGNHFFPETMRKSDLRSEALFRKLWKIHIFKLHLFLLTYRIWSHSPDFGQPKHGPKIPKKWINSK